MLVIAMAMALGGYLNDGLRTMGFTLPEFLTALLSGIALSNVVPSGPTSPKPPLTTCAMPTCGAASRITDAHVAAGTATSR